MNGVQNVMNATKARKECLPSVSQTAQNGNIVPLPTNYLTGQPTVQTPTH